MNFEICKLSRDAQLVHFDRLGLIGEFRRYNRRWKFFYTSDTWIRLKYNENIALLAFIENPLKLLNITERLKS